MNLLALVLTAVVSVTHGVAPESIPVYPQVTEESALEYSEIYCNGINQSIRRSWYSTMVTITYEDGSWEPGNGRWYFVDTYVANRCMI